MEEEILKEAGLVKMIDTLESVTNQRLNGDPPNVGCCFTPNSELRTQKKEKAVRLASFSAKEEETLKIRDVQRHTACKLIIRSTVDNACAESHTSGASLRDSKSNRLASNHSGSSRYLLQTVDLVLGGPLKLLGMVGHNVLTNQRRDRSVEGWTALYWVFLLVSWQISGSLGRPSTRELMHMEARLDIIEKLDSQSAGVDRSTLYHPEGRDRTDWLSCHGQPCDDWNKVQRILTELHLIDLNVNPTTVQNDGPLSNLFLDLISGPAMESAVGNNELTRPWEGTDILLTLEDAEELYMEVLHKVLGSGKRRRKRKINRDDTKRWDFPIVYKMDGSHSAHEESIIEKAIKVWEAETCVRFKKVDHQDRVEDSHVIFTKGQYSCASYVGMMRFGKYNPQPINLGSSCFEKLGVPVHEIGHALGLWHEHQRPIRDKHIVVDSSNIFFWAYNNFMAGSTTHVEDFGVPYDYNSVMHYGAMIGSRNGRPTLRPIDSQFKYNMGQREELSFLDTKVVNKAYCEDICGTSATRKPCQNGGYQDPNNCELCKCPDGLSGDDCTEVASSKKAQCGGRYSLSRHGEELHLETPGHTAGAYYIYGTECYWLIETNPRNQLRLTFEGEFNLMCEFETCNHWVEVKTHSDLSENGPRFCCSQPPTSTLVSDTGKMVVIFKSIAEPKYENYIGFRAVVTLVTNEVVRTEPEQPSDSPPLAGTGFNVAGQTEQGIEPTPVISTSQSVPTTGAPDTTSVQTETAVLITTLQNRREEEVDNNSSIKTVEPQKSRNQRNRKKKKKPPKARKKLTEVTTERIPITEPTTRTVVTGTWHIQTSTPVQVTSRERLEGSETPGGSNHETQLYTQTSRASQPHTQTELPKPSPKETPTPRETSQTTPKPTDKPKYMALPTEASQTTEKLSKISPKSRHSKKTKTSSIERRRKQQSRQQSSEKQAQKYGNNEEVATTIVPPKQKQKYKKKQVVSSKVIEDNEENRRATIKSRHGIKPVIEEHEHIPSTALPATTPQENSKEGVIPDNMQTNVKNQSNKSTIYVVGTLEEEGSSMFLPVYSESPSTTQTTKTSVITTTTEGAHSTPERQPKRTYWRAKKPNMKLVFAARRRAARRRVQERKKLLQEAKKNNQLKTTLHPGHPGNKSKVETDDTKIMKTSNTDKSKRNKNSHINRENNTITRKDSEIYPPISGHTKQTVTITSTENEHISYKMTYITYNISQVNPTDPVVTHRQAATSKSSKAQSKPSIAQSNTIHSTESSDSETATPPEGETVTRQHSTPSISQPITVQSTDRPTTATTTTTATTSEQTSTKEPSTTSSSQKPTTTTTEKPTTQSSTSITWNSTSVTQSSTSLTAEGYEKWTDWSSCLGMDCKCGGCSWRIRYKLCGQSPCQGQEMRSERRPCDQVCGKEDTERFWVARFYTRYTYFRVKRQCSECCGGFERQGDRCVLQEK